MKKFALFAMSVVALVSVKAATVEWTSGDLSDIVTAEMKASEISGVTAYYYVIDKSAYEESESMEALVTKYVDKATGKLTTEGKAYDQKVESNPIGYADWTQTYAGDSAYVAVVYMFDSLFGGAYAVAGKGAYSEGTGGLYNDPDLDFSGEIATTAYEANGWVAVPEPTTVALLALGLAAVGLKRKVA